MPSDNLNIDFGMPYIGLDKLDIGTDKTDIGDDKANIAFDKRCIGADKMDMVLDKLCTDADKPHIAVDNAYMDRDKQNIDVPKPSTDAFWPTMDILQLDIANIPLLFVHNVHFGNTQQISTMQKTPTNGASKSLTGTYKQSNKVWNLFMRTKLIYSRQRTG